MRDLRQESWHKGQPTVSGNETTFFNRKFADFEPIAVSTCDYTVTERIFIAFYARTVGKNSPPAPTWLDIFGQSTLANDHTNVNRVNWVIGAPLPF